MKRVSLCCTSAPPTSLPGPVMKFSTCLGRPLSYISCTKCAATAGDWLAGLITTVLPATSAATAMPAMIASGKFHGGMIAPTPSGM